MKKYPIRKFEYSTAKELKQFDLEIKMSTDLRFFYTVNQLPKEILDRDLAPGGDRQYFDSYYELHDSVMRIIAEFETAFVQENKTKVILYAIDTKSYDSHQEIDFRYEVVQKVEIGNSKGTTKKYYKERHHSGRATGTTMDELSHSAFNDEFKEINWTKDREEWFKKMNHAIETLSRNLESGLKQTPEVLARKIDQGLSFQLLESKRGEK